MTTNTLTDAEIVAKVLRYLPTQEKLDEIKRKWAEFVQSSSIERAVTFGDLEAVITYEQALRLSWGAAEYFAGSSDVAALKTMLVELARRLVSDLTTGSPWKHNSTSAMANIVNMCSATARVNLLRDIDYALGELNTLSR